MGSLSILAFAGSTREGSYNEELIEEAANIATEMGAKVTRISLSDFPASIYQADDEKAKGMPETMRKLSQLFIEHDAIMIASPQYNASISPLLKNTLDWLSRVRGENRSHPCFDGKYFAIMSASPGKGGGREGLCHLSDIIIDIGGTIIPTRTTVGNAYDYFSEKDRTENSQLRKEVGELMDAIRQHSDVAESFQG